MTGSRWEDEELDALEFFVKKKEEHLEALAQSGERERGAERKWTWSQIAQKMQKVADRDRWEYNRRYEASNCHFAWQTFRALKAEVKAEAEDDMHGIEPNFIHEHGTGETVDALQIETAIDINGSQAPAITQNRPASQTAANNPSQGLQVRFEHGIDDTVDVHFDATANTITIAPKASDLAAEKVSESATRIKAEQAGHHRLAPPFVDGTARILNFGLNPDPTQFSNQMGDFNTLEDHGGSASPAPSLQHEVPTRLNARWEDHEVDALKWFVKKREDESEFGRRHARARNWTWEVIATKMNKVASRDGWDTERVYTAGNCYGAWNTMSTRLPTSRPSTSRRHNASTRPAAASSTGPQQMGDTVGVAIPDTINGPPPPGPDGATNAAPYHWLPAEREALHDVYVFSRIEENKLLSRGECRRRGNWTWTMVAREMNYRAQGASWNVGRVYDQSNCYNMIKYEKDNFNLKGNVQPLEPDEKGEGQDDF
ncbi:hypothetical protein BKA65DRAFT_590979 [Rhexocercosporidium sp. MPI-PUGE-AT-0058]|nr:hypothetical protein BKA65DRAFT_590979 [Rhexocercosporidium sp. MPI-PUGE-AT-0058]